MLNSDTTNRQYRPIEIKAIDYVQSYKKILDGTYDTSAFFDLLVIAAGTPYEYSPADYLRYEMYPDDMSLGHPYRIGYYTKNGDYRVCDIRDQNDLDQYFHELLESWDDLDLPSPEDYLGYGFSYGDTNFALIDSFSWAA